MLCVVRCSCYCFVLLLFVVRCVRVVAFFGCLFIVDCGSLMVLVCCLMFVGVCFSLSMFDVVCGVLFVVCCWLFVIVC